MDFWKNLRIHVIVLNRVLGVLEADDSAFFYTCSVNEVKNMNIAEIAKMAGVSSAAVSRYFNNGYISEEKRQAIKKVVDETGYRPSAQAQTLRTKKTKMIGVILPRINSPAMGSVVSGILNILDQNDYRLLLANTQNNLKKEIEYLEFFSDKQVDGIIFAATVFTGKHKKILKNLRIPIVIVGQKLPGYHCIYNDDYHAAYDLTKLMIEQGRTKLAYIGVFELDEAAGLERHTGFLSAAKEAGLDEVDQRYEIAAFTIESGYEKTKELMEMYPDTNGIVCAMDYIAVGAMKYLAEHGIRVPEEVMVAGHGDSDMSPVTTPGLTTVHFAYEKNGILAARMILDMISGKEQDIKEMKLDYSLIVRDSTREK